MKIGIRRDLKPINKQGICREAYSQVTSSQSTATVNSNQLMALS